MASVLRKYLFPKYKVPTLLSLTLLLCNLIGRLAGGMGMMDLSSLHPLTRSCWEKRKVSRSSIVGSMWCDRSETDRRWRPLLSALHMLQVWERWGHQDLFRWKNSVKRTCMGVSACVLCCIVWGKKAILGQADAWQEKRWGPPLVTNRSANIRWYNPSFLKREVVGV